MLQMLGAVPGVYLTLGVLCACCRFGVREHGMGAICNGIGLHNTGLIPYCATFYIFTDYMRAAMRMSALSEVGSMHCSQARRCGWNVRELPWRETGPVPASATILGDPETTMCAVRQSNTASSALSLQRLGWQFFMQG